MFVTSPQLSQFSAITHAFFTREGGVSTGIYASLNAGIGSNDTPENVKENRARMAKAMGLAPQNLLSSYQTHSATAIIVTEPFIERPQCDGLVTNVKGLALAAASADCGTLLFYDPKANVIGSCHAGWKGALGGICEATINKMVELGATTAHIHVSLGAMIQQQSYEVGQEFVEAIKAKSNDYAAFFIPSIKPNHFMFNLPQFIIARLKAKSIIHIDNLGLDTYSDPRFYSYRRMTHRGEPDYGRQLAVIALKEKL